MQTKFFKVNLTQGSKDISNLFVENVKNMKSYELSTLLKTEVNNFKVEKRITKKKKMLDRINVVVDRMCKNLEISDLKSFEKNSTILSIVKMLECADLAFEVLDEHRVVVEYSLTSPEVAA